MNRESCSLWQSIQITPGTKADYAPLAHYHYRAARPIAVTRVLTARYSPIENRKSKIENEVIAVLVETRPVLNCALRNLALPNQYTSPDKRLAAQRLNHDVTTIARVVVDPRFRGIGIAHALVAHALATTATPRVEALASLARHQPFFQSAGMTRYDRPLPPQNARLLAALHHENLLPADLPTLAPAQLSPFLQSELLRFARRTAGFQPASHTKNLRRALQEAQQRLLSWPAYYLWQNPNSTLPAPTPPPQLAQMPEAFTIFLPAADKQQLTHRLRQVHPDLAVALTQCITCSTPVDANYGETRE